MSLSLIFGSLFVGTYLLSSIGTIAAPGHTHIATVSATVAPVYLATPRAVPAPLPVALTTPVPAPLVVATPRPESQEPQQPQQPVPTSVPQAYPGELGLSTPLPQTAPVSGYVQPTGLRYLRILLFRLIKVFIITVSILVIILLVPLSARYLLTDSISSLKEIRDGLAVLEQEEAADAPDTRDGLATLDQEEAPVVEDEAVAAEALLSLRNSVIEPAPAAVRLRRVRRLSAAPLRNIKPDQD